VDGLSVRVRVNDKKGYLNYKVRSKTRLQDEQGQLGTKRANIRKGGPPDLRAGRKAHFVGRGDGTFERVERKSKGQKRRIRFKAPK
jgi:hypothetical protein